MAEITLVEAITQALRYEMRQDESVVVMGEDIAKNGGVFRATLGLLDEFGPERVRDTPDRSPWKRAGFRWSRAARQAWVCLRLCRNHEPSLPRILRAMP